MQILQNNLQLNIWVSISLCGNIQHTINQVQNLGIPILNYIRAIKNFFDLLTFASQLWIVLSSSKFEPFFLFQKNDHFIKVYKKTTDNIPSKSCGFKTYPCRPLKRVAFNLAQQLAESVKMPSCRQEAETLIGTTSSILHLL